MATYQKHSQIYTEEIHGLASQSSISGEEVEAAIRDLPREAEIVSLYKNLADHGPIPAR